MALGRFPGRRCVYHARLRAAQHWVNQTGWDATGEGCAVSSSTGKEINLRLDWTAVSQALARGGGVDVEDALAILDPQEVAKDYPLERLDPIQRAFADRVLAWARELVNTYKRVMATGLWGPGTCKTCKPCSRC